MQAVDLLLSRCSQPLLTDPAPSAEALETILQSALRAPDHGQLRPWRFLIIEGEARSKLGALFVDATRAQQLDENKLQKISQKPFRAPMIIAVIACLQDHPKVPEVEQILSAGCAAHGIVMAAQALGYGAIWRTGGLCYDSIVMRGLGLGDNEKLVGFIYLGSVKGSGKQKVLLDKDTSEFVTRWGGVN